MRPRPPRLLALGHAVATLLSVRSGSTSGRGEASLRAAVKGTDEITVRGRKASYPNTFANPRPSKITPNRGFGR